MLADRYELLQELGKGGMGVVYQGYDTRLNRAVAIKFISKSEIGTEGRARLMAEARAAAQLNHPNIVTIYDAVDDDENPYIVMELVEGKTLRETPIKDLGQAIEYTRQICLALDHAHQKKVIHRDLKPENVIVVSDGTIKLMDFGLARTTNAPRLTQSGTFVGTISYVAPELLQGKEPSPQSDLYALGIMVFEMVTGEYPFHGSDIIQIISQHLHASIPSPNQLKPDIPDVLNSLILQLLEKKPEQRPASASEVQERIVSLLIQQNRATRPPFPSSENFQSILELAKQRKQAQNQWEKEWRQKGYIKSSLPVLEPVERELILSNQAKELKRGIEYLKDHRILIITGMPGIGKSTLARAILEFMPINSPPPFWYDFERQRSSGNSLGILLDRISSYLENCLGGDVHQEVMSFRQSPDGRASIHDVDILIDYLNQDVPIWLVFDNLETVLSRGANGFRDPDLELLFDGLKNNSHNAKIIITNPFVPILHDGQYLLEFGSQPLNLNGLDENSSIDYLRAFGLHNFDKESLSALARTASGHPFTLNHIAHYVQSMGATQDLDTLQSGLDEITNQFKLSLEHRLSHQEFNALQALSILDREISLEGLRQTANATSTVIKRLREEGLLQTNDTGKFWLHNIVRTSLSSTGAEITQPAHTRAFNFYRNQKAPLNKQGIDDYVNVLEWHHHAVQAGDAESSYEALFFTGLVEQLTKWNEYNLLTGLCGETLFVLSQSDIPEHEGKKIKLLHTLGITFFYLYEYNRSIENLNIARELTARTNNLPERIEVLIDLADSYNGIRDFASAMQVCQEAITLLPPSGDELLRAKALHLRGVIHRDHGNLDEAEKDLNSALDLYKTTNSYTHIAHTTGDLGVVYYYKNRFDNAVAMYRDVIEACAEVNDLRGMMLTHYNIGEIMLLRRNYDDAINDFTSAFNIARKKRIAWMELWVGLYLIEAHIERRQLETAEDLLGSIDPILKTNTSASILGREQILHAALQWKKGQLDQAEESFGKAFNYLEKNEDCEFECARAYVLHSQYLKEQKAFTKAREALQKAEVVFVRLDNQLCLQTVEQELAGITDVS